MDIHIAICDDEESQITYLHKIVSNWAQAEKRNVGITTFDSAEAFMFSFEEDKSFDILLLDIQMKEMDGIQLAKQLRNTDERTQIIFITGYPDFIAEGYEVSALHYLMKPVNEDKLFEILNKAVMRLTIIPRTILFPKAGGSIRIPADDILYAESFSHTVMLYTKSGMEEFNTRITDMEKLLDNGFFRCHRSYIVSMKHVRRVTKKAVLLDNGKEIPLSRSLYDGANQMFIKYN